MRRVLALTTALALCGPMVAQAAGSGTSSDVTQLVGAYQHIQSVRVVENFENGAVATVDVIPSGQYRIASSGGQDPSLIIKIATQPVGDAYNTGNYNVNTVGKKTIDGAKTTGVHVVAPDGSYDATVWVNDYHLPVEAQVSTQGHRINVTYGDYNDSALVAKP